MEHTWNTCPQALLLCNMNASARAYVRVLCVLNFRMCLSTMPYTLLIFTILFVFSLEGGDQQCCYGPTGELLPYAKGGGTVSRFSATHQPLLYIQQDFWPRIVCDQLAKQSSAYQQRRPTDDCSGYVRPKQGVWKN